MAAVAALCEQPQTANRIILCAGMFTAACTQRPEDPIWDASPPLLFAFHLRAPTSGALSAGRTLESEDLDWITDVHDVLHAGMKWRGPTFALVMAQNIRIYYVYVCTYIYTHHTMRTSRPAFFDVFADMQAEKLCPPGRVLLVHQIMPLTEARTADAVLTDPLNLDTLPNSTESLPTLATDTATDGQQRQEAARAVESLADGMGSPSFSTSQELASALGSDEVGDEAPWQNTTTATGSSRRLTKSEVAIDPQMDDPWQDTAEGLRDRGGMPVENPPFDSAPPRTRRRHRLSTNGCVAQRLCKIVVAACMWCYVCVLSRLLLIITY